MVTQYYTIYSAADDITDSDEVRTLVKDISDIRAAKLRLSIDEMITSQQLYATVRQPHPLS